MKRILLLVLLASMLIAGACGDNKSTTAPSNTTDGTYGGTITDSLLGGGTATLTIALNGSNITGTWDTTFALNAKLSGTLTGTLNGTTLTATLASTNAALCPLALTATLNGSQISGTYTAVNCSVADTGSVNLTKK